MQITSVVVVSDEATGATVSASARVKLRCLATLDETFGPSRARGQETVAQTLGLPPPRTLIPGSLTPAAALNYAWCCGVHGVILEYAKPACQYAEWLSWLVIRPAAAMGRNSPKHNPGQP